MDLRRPCRWPPHIGRSAPKLGGAVLRAPPHPALHFRTTVRLLLLTFVRSAEARFATWDEFEGLDGDTPLWRIPAERMKGKIEHFVPLSPRAVCILNELRNPSGDSRYVFPSPSKKAWCPRIRGFLRYIGWDTTLDSLF